MGILRFFKWVYDEHTGCLIQVKKEPYVDYKKFGKPPPKPFDIRVDSYHLDLNAIIHPICQKAFNYGNDTPQHLQKFKKKKIQPIPTLDDIYFKVCNQIDYLRRKVGVKRELVIAIDGTAGMSKQTQQRQRRFVSAAEKKDEDFDKFDSNCISTGTEFMYELSSKIHFWIIKQLNTNKEWEGLKIVFINEKVPGEGEHKIIRYIEKNYVEGWNYAVHSPDADLVMLCLGLNLKNIYIVRENIYRHVQCEYFIVNIDTLRTTLDSQMKFDSEFYNVKKVCNDFILLCYFLGNDFLPHIPSLEIPNGGMTSMITLYNKMTRPSGDYKGGCHLTKKNKGQYAIVKKYLKRLLFSLSEEEENMLSLKNTQNIKHHDPLLSECEVEGPDDIFHKRIDIFKYRKLYYLKKFNIDTDTDSGRERLKTVCLEYFKGLTFVLRYYLEEIPDYYWYYPYHYSPFFSDLYIHIDSFDTEMKFEKHSPLNSFEQLLAIMPPKSAKLVPECLRELMNENSVLGKFYPKTFEMDKEGKRSDHEAHVLLPFVEVDLLKKVYSEYQGKLTEKEKMRNFVGKSLVYEMKNERLEIDLL
jgi:5'-3' exonuclease